MPYNIHHLATLSDVSVRTLHHYDDIGLLTPKRNPKNGYRIYDEADLLQLQQILFFKELGFTLEDIKRILTSKHFDLESALQSHKKMILLKKKRIDDLLQTIDKTIKKINQQNTMTDNELYDAFSKAEMNAYQEEVKQRWGHTDAYTQSTERVKNMGKDELQQAMREHGDIAVQIAECMKQGLSPDSDEVQRLVAAHYRWLQHFYEPSMDIYRGLADMYAADERFKATYDNIADGLAEYLSDAMHVFIAGQ